MTSLKSFLTVFDAIVWIDSQGISRNLFINRELDGKYHVYDGDE